MNKKEFQKIITNKKYLEKKIKFFEKKNIIRNESNKSEIQGHLEKSEDNLRFVNEIFKLNFLDWTITGCYYSIYHLALALCIKKGKFSKNHNATILLLIKFYSEFKEEFDLINELYLNYKDLLFYSEIKEKRNLSTYSTQKILNKKEVKELKTKTIKLIIKLKEILKND
ncbi:MAG: HEPN domain-containing protein [Nanoarchaeota archaeon]|nr:HEPN domain-containing protein [Nanoarchaeota archaeon]